LQNTGEFEYEDLEMLQSIIGLIPFSGDVPKDLSLPKIFEFS